MGEKRKFFNTRMIATTGILLAVQILLQVVLMFIIPTPVNMNLGLIPIVLGAILYGPIVGGFLGFTSGVIVLLSPNTNDLFLAINPVATVFTCLLKTLLAGVLAGFIFNALKKKNNFLGSILASITVPLVNTMVFAIFCYFFFKDGLLARGFNVPTFGAIFTVLIGINFIVEILTTTVIGPSLYKIIEQQRKNKASD